MRWIDIILPEPGIHQDFDALVFEARELLDGLPVIQQRDGLDCTTVLERMTAIGNKLFQATISTDPGAFTADTSRSGYTMPDLGREPHDELLGFHLAVAPSQLDLPWHWAHNGLIFLLEKHPLCVADRPSNLPAGAELRPWMQRLVRAGFLVGADGTNALRSILPQLRPTGAATPELLFVPGHTEPRIRRLIYREAEAIELALGAANLGNPLARLDFPAEAITPRDLSRQGLAYQAIHFAGPTSKPALMADTQGEYWMNRLMEETAASSDDRIAEAAGMEEEVLGVDPVTVLLDNVSERYDREGVTESRARSGASSGRPAGGDSPPQWLLSDGPIGPEGLNRGGGVPPLIFSNSYCALPEMGARFLGAGASTFIGPVVPLYSRPARIFAGHLYDAMGDGWCAGTAVWQAARACRDELGDEHPAWLSYGVQGHGSLAFQYL